MNSDKIKNNLELIALDRISGASELARHCLRFMATLADSLPADTVDELLEQLCDYSKQVIAIRPNVAPIQNLMLQWVDDLDELDSTSLHELRQYATEQASYLTQQSYEAVKKAAAHTAEHLSEYPTIMTHSYGSTVRESLLLLDAEQRVIITESRPLYEGYHLAETLSKHNVNTTLISDAQMGTFISEANIVIVGADAILPDGSVINKVGTYLLALAAQEENIPFYVCCESFKKFATEPENFHLEENKPEELNAPDLPNVKVRNICYDITPKHLLTGWINEDGIMTDMFMAGGDW